MCTENRVTSENGYMIFYQIHLVLVIHLSIFNPLSCIPNRQLWVGKLLKIDRKNCKDPKPTEKKKKKGPPNMPKRISQIDLGFNSIFDMKLD